MKKLLLILIPVIIIASGCSTVNTVVGHVDPADQKSEDYGVLDLSKDSSKGWKKVSVEPEHDSYEGTGKDPDAQTTEVSDASYQSKDGSIISINSACRKGRHLSNTSLKEFTQQLVMGMTDITFKEERDSTIQRQPALQTTLIGKMNLEPVKLRTVVIQREDCVFDLMYVARPETFAAHEYEFSNFVSSLRLK